MAQKKSERDAFRLTLGQGTDDPVLSQMCLARMVNQLSGAAVVAPWDVEQLPDEWLDAFEAMAEQMTAKEKREKRRREAEAKRRRSGVRRHG